MLHWSLDLLRLVLFSMIAHSHPRTPPAGASPPPHAPPALGRERRHAWAVPKQIAHRLPMIKKELHIKDFCSGMFDWEEQTQTHMFTVSNQT